jgi:hypothetical protein
MLGGERALIDAIDEGLSQGLDSAGGSLGPDPKSPAKTSTLPSFFGFFLINVGDAGSRAFCPVAAFLENLLLTGPSTIAPEPAQGDLRLHPDSLF